MPPFPLLLHQCFLAGVWEDASSGATLPVFDPASRHVIARIPNMGATETSLAIAAAKSAQPAWAARTAAERARIIQAWRAGMEAHREDLAAIMCAENGKPMKEARGEVTYAASFLEWFAEEAKRAYGDIIPSAVPGARLLVLKHAVGVCAAITPWNFPLAMITRKAGAALAAGCAVVLKPSELTPLSAFALAELAARAGLPAGLLSVVTGDAAPIGGELCSNPDVRKLTFTGSTRVGKALMAACAPTVKRLSLELGGNAPFIVFDVRGGRAGGSGGRGYSGGRGFGAGGRPQRSAPASAEQLPSGLSCLALPDLCSRNT